jgi:hypothetical protein
VEESLNDAFRRAVDEAGAMVDAEMVIENDKVAKDRIFVFSDGFVVKHDVVQTRYEQGLFYRKIQATVQQRNLVSKSAGVDSVDASDLYGEAYTKLRRRQIGLSIIQSELERCGGDLLRSESVVLGHPEPVAGADDRVRVPFESTVSVDEQKYRKIRDRLIYVLEPLAKYSGTVDTTFSRVKQAPQTPVEKTLRDNAIRWMTARFSMPSTGNANAQDMMIGFDPVELITKPRSTGNLPDNAMTHVPTDPSTLLVIYDAETDSRNATWRWFEIEAQFKVPVVKAVASVRYLDSDKKPVRSERFEMGPGMPGISVGVPNANLQSMVLGPFFLCHVGKGYFCLTAPLSRSISLHGQAVFQLAALAPVKSVDLVIGTENPIGKVSVDAGEVYGGEGTEPIAAPEKRGTERSVQPTPGFKLIYQDDSRWFVEYRVHLLRNSGEIIVAARNLNTSDIENVRDVRSRLTIVTTDILRQLRTKNPHAHITENGLHDEQSDSSFVRTVRLRVRPQDKTKDTKK